MSCDRSQKEAEQHPENDVVYARNSKREMPNGVSQQPHFADDRSENGKRLHAHDYPDRRDEFRPIDPRQKFLGIARQDPVTGEASETHRDKNVRCSQCQKLAIAATEGAGGDMQSSDESEDEHRQDGKPGKRG
jgi:hypothetical protein